MKPLFYLLLNAFQLAFLLFWSALWISLALVALLVTFNRALPLAMARRFWAPGLLTFAFAKLQRAPLPDFDFAQPHVFVMNHQSMLDIPCAFAGIPANVRFVAKHVLKYVPFLGWYMWATGMIFVNRSDRTQSVKSIAEAGARIRGGVNILAFPEGTRSKSGDVLPFKKGAFILAIEAGVPVVPVAISNSGRILPTGTFSIRPGTVRMKIGAPIPTAGRGLDDRDALAKEVREAIIALKRELGDGQDSVPARDSARPGLTKELRGS
jgi:1-acyl-sn-glycerol-3-phosphate acyltransferase